MRALLACLVLAGCAAETVAPQQSDAPRDASNPLRIISLDYCADQYVLKLAPREAIAALSPDATKAFSYLAAEAAGLPQVTARTEDILALKPDLIVRSYGGGPNLARFFGQLNIPVLNVGWASDIEGIKSVTRDMAAGLGATQAGEVLVTEIDARLSALPATSGGSALYVTPSGVTSGQGSLVDDILRTAGYRNFETRAGWHDLPLERLTSAQPDIIAAGFFDTKSQNKDVWSAARHPIAKTAISDQKTVPLNGAWMSCGAWYAMDAVDALASAHND